MTPEHIAGAFRTARLAAQPLERYPDSVAPDSLDKAYAIQDVAIDAWPDRVAGWKVAAILPSWRDAFPAERLAGPVFAKNLWEAPAGQAATARIIPGGYAAAEVEFAIRIGSDIPASGDFSDPRQLLPYVEGVYGALEIAGSPLLTLNSLGPGAVISDFGNNTGLVIGPKLPMSVLDQPETASSRALLNQELAGEGNAGRVPGGPLGALLFLVNHLAARHRGLHAGEWVSTGASAGIHVIKAGDRVEARYCDTYDLVTDIIAGLPV